MKSKFFKLAKKLSEKSDHHSHHLGCVIVNKNSVISVGFNQLKTHSKSPHKYKMLHAEISALLGNTYRELKGCTAYIYREHRSGEKALAKPCPSCEIALKEAGIKKVCYTTEEGYKEERL